MHLHDLFFEAGSVDAILMKIITSNDDSGRHGILIPKEGYILFPEFDKFDSEAADNYTAEIETISRIDEKPIIIQSSWKHYHRYPERRVTALRSKRLNAAPPKTIVVFGKYKTRKSTYEFHIVYPTDLLYEAVLAAFGFSSHEAEPGLFGLLTSWDANRTVHRSAVLNKFLQKFDSISALGFVKTLRPGDTGVGFTFESLMGIKENNDQKADFNGIEIKTYRSEDVGLNGREKMNLFLKAPTWLDKLSGVDRVVLYGYQDETGRPALYSAVTTIPNAHLFMFCIDFNNSRLVLIRNGVEVAFWGFSALQARLSEKLNAAVFIAAHTKKINSIEHFHYRNVTYLENPSLDAFLRLVRTGDVMIELKMHVANNKLRDHGVGFRIKKNKLSELYSSVVQYRPIVPK